MNGSQIIYFLFCWSIVWILDQTSNPRQYWYKKCRKISVNLTFVSVNFIAQNYNSEKVRMHLITSQNCWLLGPWAPPPLDPSPRWRGSFVTFSEEIPVSLSHVWNEEMTQQMIPVESERLKPLLVADNMHFYWIISVETDLKILYFILYFQYFDTLFWHYVILYYLKLRWQHCKCLFIDFKACL